MSSEKSAGSEAEHLAPLLATLGDLSAWLQAMEVPGAVAMKSLTICIMAFDERICLTFDDHNAILQKV